ncbi:WD40-repeat-containing domain protein [Chytriomyces sp. MP71]|nr:WD40-repeat-containing domain protein [Chytriomyces sp. MP71]
MQSNDADHFFQSDRDLELAAAREAKKQSLLAAKPGATKSLSVAKATSKVLCWRLVRGTEDKVLAVVGESGHVARMTDLATGRASVTYRGHKGPVTCVEIQYDSASGTPGFVLTGSWDKSIRKFDAKTGESLQTFTGHADFVKCILLVPAFVDSKLSYILLSGSSDSTIKKWDTNAGKLLQTWKSHTRPVEALVLAESDEATAQILHVYSGSSDTSIRKWDVEAGTVMQTLPGHLTSVYNLAMVDDELWSVSADKTAKRWNLEAAKPDSSFEHPDFVKCICVHGSYVITGCRDENIRVFDLTSEKCINVIEGHFGEVSCLEVAGGRLWSGSLDATIRSWDLAGGIFFVHVAWGKFTPLL